MITEKWVCNKCGSECRVEIVFDETGPAGDSRRFRGRCLAGTRDFPEEQNPDWVRQNKGNLDNSASFFQKEKKLSKNGG